MEHILGEMKLARDHHGQNIFEFDLVEKVAKRAVDG